jgi:hypothetical protein
VLEEVRKWIKVLNFLGPVISAAFSQEGRLAIDIALKGCSEAFIALCPTVREVPEVSSPVIGKIIVGRRDLFRENEGALRKNHSLWVDNLNLKPSTGASIPRGRGKESRVQINPLQELSNKIHLHMEFKQYYCSYSMPLENY